MTSFTKVLDSFTDAVERGDGAALSLLFTPDGSYHDMFYGAFTGRAAIRDMLARFHNDGERFRWQMFDPVADGRTGYARWLFSFDSRRPATRGRRVVIEGVGHFSLDAGLIRRYEDMARSAECLVSLGLPDDAIVGVARKWATAQEGRPDVREHLDG
jgi:hypothetical protein